MSHLYDTARAKAQLCSAGRAVDARMLLFGLAAAVAFCIAVLLPSSAAAVPGSGEFVALKSESGREITELYNLIARICLGILIVVEGILLFAIFKFRRRSSDENPAQNHGDLRLEFGWTMAAIIIQVWIGVATINTMFTTETEPDEGIDMVVTAHAEMWDWSFEYDPPTDEEGNLDDDAVFPTDEGLRHEDLVVPAHKNVKIQVTSQDVIHAIFIPALGVKMDAVPGRFNHWWFRADGPIGQVRAEDHPTIDRPDFEYPQTRSGRLLDNDDNPTERRVTGLEQHVDYLSDRTNYEQIDYEESPYLDYNAIEYQGTCAELCGRDHWNMYFRAVVMTPSSFQRWYMDELEDVEVREGPVVYDAECAECHGAEGGGVGDDPALAGNPIVTDEDRAEEHIELVLTGPARMPSFHQDLNDEEMVEVVNHERTSWGNDGGEVSVEDVVAVRERLHEEGGEHVDPEVVDPEFPVTVEDPEPEGELMRHGERLYRSCAQCHGEDGRSIDTNLAPDLANNEVVVAEEPDELQRILLEGQDTDEYPGRKRAVARGMSDMELASLMTYIRRSFDNDAPEVQPFDVAEIRRELIRDDGE